MVIFDVERRQIGAERHARRAGKRRHVDEQVWRFLVSERQGIGKDKPPLGIGVADLDGSPLRRVSTSPGRKALPAIAFSTAGMRTRSRTGSFCPIIISASASTPAAPPISFFISSMPAAGLMSRPPVSKHTPLPTSVTLASVTGPR